jgi:prevent-host-death family protein
MLKLTNIKPISYFKANAAEMLQVLRETGEPYVITQNGEAAAVLMDVKDYEQIQEKLARMQIVAMSDKQIREGKSVALSAASEQLRNRLASKK